MRPQRPSGTASRFDGDNLKTARLLDQIGSGEELEQAWLSASGSPLDVSEKRWRRAALLWHRWIPALASSGSLWLMVTALALVAGVRRRQKTLRIRRRWQLEEASSESPSHQWSGIDSDISNGVENDEEIVN